MHCLSSRTLGFFTSQKSPNFVILGSFLTPFGLIFWLIFRLIFGPIFGLSKKAKFRTSLPERKSTGNSVLEFPGSGSHFPENTPDFKNVTGTHCLARDPFETDTKFKPIQNLFQQNCSILNRPLSFGLTWWNKFANVNTMYCGIWTRWVSEGKKCWRMFLMINLADSQSARSKKISNVWPEC